MDRGNRRFLGALIIIDLTLRYTGFRRDGPGLVLLLVSAACFAVYQILTRKLSDRDSAETMIVYMPLTGAIAMSCAMPFVGVIPEGWSNWTLFILVGVLGGFTQYFVTKSLEQAPASVVSPYLYGELLVAAIVGFAIFVISRHLDVGWCRRHSGERHLYCLSRSVLKSRNN